MRTDGYEEDGMSERINNEMECEVRQCGMKTNIEWKKWAIWVWGGMTFIQKSTGEEGETRRASAKAVDPSRECK